jgi:hypothetical protein
MISLGLALLVTRKRANRPFDFFFLFFVFDFKPLSPRCANGHSFNLFQLLRARHQPDQFAFFERSRPFVRAALSPRIHPHNSISVSLFPWGKSGPISSFSSGAKSHQVHGHLYILPHNQLISRERLYRGLFNLLLMMSLQRLVSAWSRWASAVLIELATPGSAGLCLGTYRAHVVHRWSCPVSPGSYNNAGAPASDHYKEVSMSMF